MFLRKEQGVLIEQLKRRSPEIADMYYGGLCSFADEKNPFRLPLAAHAFREVIAHCARLTGEPAQARQRGVPGMEADECDCCGFHRYYRRHVGRFAERPRGVL
jgi:hypothetical protein